MPRKSRDPKTNAQATAIARAAWSVKPDQASVQARLRISANLKEVWNNQDTDERGQCWEIGLALQPHLGWLKDLLQSQDLQTNEANTLLQVLKNYKD